MYWTIDTIIERILNVKLFICNKHNSKIVKITIDLSAICSIEMQITDRLE